MNEPTVSSRQRSASPEVLPSAVFRWWYAYRSLLGVGDGDNVDGGVSGAVAAADGDRGQAEPSLGQPSDRSSGNHEPVTTVSYRTLRTRRFEHAPPRHASRKHG